MAKVTVKGSGEAKAGDSAKAAEKGRDAAPASPPASHGVPSPLTDLRSEIDRLFSDFSGRFPSFSGGLFDWEPWRGASYSGLSAPRVDLTETDGVYEVMAELPGLEAADVSVELRDNVLTLSGEKREEKDRKEKDYHMSERRFGSFRRTFRLPSEIDADKTEAVFDKGVLRVTLAKSPAAKEKTRKIGIRTK